MTGLFKIPSRFIQISIKNSAKVRRPPVVAFMGHVDHGKTTLLDNLRNSQIVKDEFGGITQHIGAFVVPFKQKQLVTFLDTPGHAAFASMRQRGAHITDIIVLVVAIDDGVLDQTIESIRFAQKSKVPIIVAVNKVDKCPDPKTIDKNIELVRKQLFVHNIITEHDGGEVQLVKMSALKGINIEYLKEAILALAETLDLKAEVDCYVKGHVIESQVHPYRGKICTVLVTEGVLKKGDVLIAGSSNYARVRALINERGQPEASCHPGLPILVTGWREDQLPAAGDSISQVKNEQEAKKILSDHQRFKSLTKAKKDAEAAAKKAEQHDQIYKEKLREKQLSGRVYKPTLFERGKRPEKAVMDDGTIRKINVILKCDVDGSLEAILDLLETYDMDNKQLVKLDIMHSGVGAITENDYVLAASFPNSIIYGFNVRPVNQTLVSRAKHDGVNLKLFNVIYHLIDDLKVRIVDMMPEFEQEIDVASANVIQEFVVKEGKIKIHVAGCRCNRGMLTKEMYYRLVRNNEQLAKDMQVKTLKHLKDDARHIEKDQECGISFEDNTIQFLPGDTLIAYEKRKYKPRLKWDLKGFN